MKYNKILLLALSLPVFFTACNDDEKIVINNNVATVEFETTELTLKESTNFVLMPIIVKSEGKRDGDVYVKVTMKENNANFVLDEDIVITTQTLRIPPEIESINFETTLYVDNEEIVKGRNVTFEIVEARGASLTANAACRINILERIFAEGTYAIRGINPFDEMMSTGACRLYSKDESIENMQLDFGLGGAIDIKFTEIVPDAEYDIEIPAFKNIGSYQGAAVIFSWAFWNKESEEILYSKENPVKGKFVREVKDGKESVVITFEDGFGLIEDRDGKYAWFYNVWVEKPTMTKVQ